MKKQFIKIEERLAMASQYLIGAGIICQVIAVISGSPYGWLSLPAVCFLGCGYYGSLKAKMREPLLTGWFYGLMLISFLGPVIGPIAAIQKLSSMGRSGARIDRPKTKRQSLIAVAVALVIAAIMAMLS